MTIKEKLSNDLKEAMRNKDQVKMETIRSISNAIINFEKANPGKEADLTKILRQVENQRKQSIEGFEAAGSKENADKERSELKIVQEYITEFLPKQMTEEEIKDVMAGIIVANGNNIGKIMGEFSKNYKGKADMQLVNKIVKSLLS